MSRFALHISYVCTFLSPHHFSWPCFSFFFAWSSFNWTCVIAAHAYYVLRTGLVANSEREFALEKMYVGVMALVMLGVFAPCLAYFYFAESGNTGIDNTNILLSVFLVLQWLWVMCICCLMYCGGLKGAQSEAANAYKRQVVMFLVVFLLLTVQRVIFGIVYATGHLNLSNKGDLYLYNFG